MKKVMATLLLFALLLGAGAALAQNATYVFPYEGFRYTQRDNETVLTQTNLHEHEALIAQLGTTKEAILASYMASGIVMEVIPEGGGQIAVSVADAGSFADVKNMADMDEVRLAAFAGQFENSGMYESCELTQTDPVCVRLTSSAMYASMPVYSLRYAMLHLGRLYMITQTIVGRAPESADDARMADVLSGMKLLATVSDPTPAPTAVPTPTPEPTPQPTPGVAEVAASEGLMEVSGVPAFTMEKKITVSGRTNPMEEVRVAVDDETLGRATAEKDGTFTVNVQLPREGELVLAVMTDTAEAMLHVTYQMPAAKLLITEPTEAVFNGDYVLIRGETEPEATVHVSGKGTSTNVKANKAGAFSIRLFVEDEGTETFTLRAKSTGMKESYADVTVTRVFTEREGLARFREKLIGVAYNSLMREPQKFVDKNFSFRGKVMEFADYNGSPCALVCVNNASVGVWNQPIWVILTGNEAIAEGNVVTFYLTSEGLTLPAAGEYTEDGNEAEAPVTRAKFVTEIK